MKTKIVAFSLFAATIPVANWMIGNVGSCVPNGPCIVPVGFGFMAPSGVLMIGLALVLRDWVHELAGVRASALAVLVGAFLSLVFSAPALALASATAFLFAEAADLLVYAKLRTRSRPFAVLASQIVGAALDSTIFVYLAFGSLEFSAGTTLAKIYAGAAVALFLTMKGQRNANA